MGVWSFADNRAVDLHRDTNNCDGAQPHGYWMRHGFDVFYFRCISCIVGTTTTTTTSCCTVSLGNNPQYAPQELDGLRYGAANGLVQVRRSIIYFAIAIRSLYSARLTVSEHSFLQYVPSTNGPRVERTAKSDV
jgi:hypothetical protein